MKAKELREFTKSELEAKLREIREKFFQLKLKHETVKLKNPLELRSLRKDIARILTVLKEK